MNRIDAIGIFLCGILAGCGGGKPVDTFSIEAAQWRRTLEDDIRLACHPDNGDPNKQGNIQCKDANGNYTFFVYR